MKIGTSLLAGLLFISAIGAINGARAEDGIQEKDQLTAGSYYHLKFPAIKAATLGNDQPVLLSADTDVIDFYGPCDEDPRGKDQVWDQKLFELHWLFKH
jgi:hypothetical protein